MFALCKGTKGTSAYSTGTHSTHSTYRGGGTLSCSISSSRDQWWRGTNKGFVPFKFTNHQLVFPPLYNNTISLLKNNGRSQFVRNFTEDKPDDKAATIDQLTSSFIKLVKNKELAEKEKKTLSSKSRVTGAEEDDILSSTTSERIVSKPRVVDEDEEEYDEEDEDEDEDDLMAAEDEDVDDDKPPATLEEWLDEYPPDVAAQLMAEESQGKSGYNEFTRVVSESEALFAPNAMVDLDPIIDTSFYDAVEEWDAEMELTGLNWDWLNFVNRDDEEDWTEEETRVFQTMPNAATNWEAAWDHLHWIGDKYFADMLDDTAAHFAKEFRVKEAFKDKITRMRQNRNKGRKERNAKRPADQKIPAMGHQQVFTNHFEWLLAKVPRDHPKAEKVFNCARLISRNATIPLKHRIIAIHILMEQLHMLPRRYSRGIPVLPPDFDEKVRKLGAR